MSAGPIGWREVIAAAGSARVLAMLGLGFASGLPFMLVGNTLGAWLRSAGIELTAIGFLSWVGLAYSLKFLWAPVVDRVSLPLLGRWLGRQRGWMVASQLTVIASLVAMVAIGPTANLVAFASCAAILALASATQDIVIDGWRIEAAADERELGLLTAAGQLGYRCALLATDALIFLLADPLGWDGAYLVFALAMVIGLAAVALAEEPRAATAPSASRGGWWARMVAAWWAPLLSLWQTHRARALLILALVLSFRLADFLLGPMANPFYVDLGLSNTQIGAIRSSFGLAGTLLGVGLAGFVAMRYGMVAALVAGALLGPGSNLCFALLALVGPDLKLFAAAMFIDNLANGFAGVALVSYMSSLAERGHSAAQYAFLTSAYALIGKILKGFSGWAVSQLALVDGLLFGYALYFALTSLIALPVLWLALRLGQVEHQARDSLP